ncbi:hypothetical protein Tco_0703697 [Tanacetum coccineum]|uniref:Uncharacterized protein n=1 Tax=Tanacetum coccineum TaxID=301880 RepID=A0ABQ4Y026_9ASTR
MISQYAILITQNTPYCLEEHIRHLDCRSQYAILSGKADMSYPTGGYGISVDLVRAKEVIGWVLEFAKEEEYDNESDDETIDENMKDNSYEKEVQKDGIDDVQSNVPFKIYELLNRKQVNGNGGEKSDGDLKCPLGFTPRDVS